jgi:hypothetical protein
VIGECIFAGAMQINEIQQHIRPRPQCGICGGAITVDEEFVCRLAKYDEAEQVCREALKLRGKC